METINLNNKEYPIRDIHIPTFGSVLISTEELNNVLMESDGNYVSEKARLIDEEIFYYVENAYFQLNETELLAKINSEI